MKKLVIVIHGGDTFPSQEVFEEMLKTKEVHLDRMKFRVDWKATLEDRLGGSYEVFLPRMPLSDNAEYALWKLWFERILDALDEVPILVGHSLGAMFLIKYYSEVSLNEKVPVLFLVAPEYLGPDMPVQEKTSFTLQEDVSLAIKNVEKIVFFHSADDPIVLFENQALFKQKLPNAEFVTFSDRGHFLLDHFPELVHAIQCLA